MITFEAPAIRADFRTGLYTKAELARNTTAIPKPLPTYSIDPKTRMSMFVRRISTTF